jgi:hypothetical protein
VYEISHRLILARISLRKFFIYENADEKPDPDFLKNHCPGKPTCNPEPCVKPSESRKNQILPIDQ